MPRYPIERKTRPHSISSVTSVGRGRSEPSSSSASSLWHEADALHALVAEDLHRRDEEAQHDPAPLARAARARSIRSGSPRSSSAVVCAASLSMNAFESGSSSTSPGSTNTSASVMSPSSSSSGFVNAACAGPAAAEHHDLLDVRLGEHLERVVGDVGRGQLLAREGEHARHVRGHVAVAHHDRALGGEVELEVAVVRDGRCTRPRTRWPPSCRAGPRPGCPCGGRSGRRPRRSPRGSGRSRSSWERSRPSSTLP